MLLLLTALLFTDVDHRAPLPAAVPAPRIVILKSKHELELYSRDVLVRTYPVNLGLEPVRPKERRGDFATPEGAYYVCGKNPKSAFDLSLALSYPSPADAERGLARGLITPAQRARIDAAWSAHKAPPGDTALGGGICIHGHGASWDWTSGCIALAGPDIHEVFRVVPVGTPVEIRP